MFWVTAASGDSGEVNLPLLLAQGRLSVQCHGGLGFRVSGLGFRGGCWAACGFDFKSSTLGRKKRDPQQGTLECNSSSGK